MPAYLAPASLDELHAALEVPEARCLAGGQSLVAMMNLGLAAPSCLVSLRRIPALRGIRRGEHGSLSIGAMTTHAEVMDLPPTSSGAALLSQAARVIAYPAIRACGTIGGAVAHADLAADYPPALVAAGAVIETASREGARRIPATDFFLGPFQTALRSGEVVVAIHLGPGGRGERASYAKLSLVAGDFAIISVAGVIGDASCIVAGGCGPKPVGVSFQGASDAALERAAREVTEASDPPSDHRASAAYRRKVLPRMILRTLRVAREAG